MVCESYYGLPFYQTRKQTGELIGLRHVDVQLQPSSNFGRSAIRSNLNASHIGKHCVDNYPLQSTAGSFIDSVPQIKAMPPRIQQPSKVVSSILRIKRAPIPRRRYATASAAIVTPPIDHHIAAAPEIRLHSATQPPSYKPAQFRKTQLLRQYASLLHSTPLTLLFQHNNLKAVEWVGLRRELVKALDKVDKANVVDGISSENLAAGTKLQIVQTGIFAAALNVVEFYKSAEGGGKLEHVLSTAAHEAVVDKRRTHELAPLLSGPLVLLTFPKVSPEHMKAALSVLAPSPEFKAPTRKANPGWHEMAVQNGVSKLLFLGARVEGKVFDVDGAKWVGSISGGIDGLRAQLVYMLQGVGASVTNTLESASKSLYLTVEGRRTMLEDESKPKEEANAE